MKKIKLNDENAKCYWSEGGSIILRIVFLFYTTLSKIINRYNTYFFINKETAVVLLLTKINQFFCKRWNTLITDFF